MHRKFFVLTVLMALGSSGAFAGVKVASLDLVTKGANGHITIGIEGRSKELPDVKVKGQTIEVTLNDATPFKAIHKKDKGATLSAKMINGKAVISTVLPYEVPAKGINLDWKNNEIEVVFPRGTVAKAAPVAKAPVKKIERKAPAVAKKQVSKIAKEALDEDYLKKLMNETKAQKKDVARRDSDVPPKNETKDTITVKQAAPAKVEEGKSGDGFSFAGYAAKFTLFLGAVLALFYGAVQLLKKGVFNRGKLGFLNNGQLIEVLSTTYVGPKRSLMVVRAHKQIFLVANSDSGITFLSEMTDTSGLMKEGEKHITGTNFDLDLKSAEATGPEKVVLKENITESSPLPNEKGIAALTHKEIVKFSDELKKKAKKLKPIEFS